LKYPHPPRPRWNHKPVKESVAKEFVGEVRDWADLNGVIATKDATEQDYLVALAVTLIESPDAYQAGRYLDDFFDWPVAGDLIRILDRAYQHMHKAVRKHVLEWVIENNIRFPGKKGEGVRFRIGDLELSGTIVEVLRHEAKAVVKLNAKDKHWNVNAEDVLQITGPVKEKKK